MVIVNMTWQKMFPYFAWGILLSQDCFKVIVNFIWWVNLSFQAQYLFENTDVCMKGECNLIWHNLCMSKTFVLTTTSFNFRANCSKGWPLNLNVNKNCLVGDIKEGGRVASEERVKVISDVRDYLNFELIFLILIWWLDFLSRSSLLD